MLARSAPHPPKRSVQASDMAIEAMNGQFLCGRQISVNYAYKKDNKVGGWFRATSTVDVRQSG
jgi:hypothetical protein